VEAAGAGDASARLRDRRWMVRKREPHAQRVDAARRPNYLYMSDERVRDIDRDGAECLTATVRRVAKMEWLASHCAGDVDDRVVVPVEAVNRQTNKRPATGLARVHGKSGLLGAGGVKCADQSDGQGRCSVVGHLSKGSSYRGGDAASATPGCATGRM
jgi:hypothetical protein